MTRTANIANIANAVNSLLRHSAMAANLRAGCLEAGLFAVPRYLVRTLMRLRTGCTIRDVRLFAVFALFALTRP